MIDNLLQIDSTKRMEIDKLLGLKWFEAFQQVQKSINFKLD